jgi:drug/metabolite transporter (DMT)-like permease
MSRASAVRLALLSLIWGSSFLLIKVALEGLAPAQVVMGRVFAGATVLLAAMVVRRVPFPRSPALWGHLAVLAVFANVVPFTLFAWGETRIDSGLAGILNGATPLLTLVFALALLPEERITRARVAGLLVGFAGVVVIVGPWRAGALSGALAGQLACLGAAACYGVAFTYTRRFVSGSGQPLLVLASSQLVVAALVLLGLSPFIAGDPMQLSARVLAAVLTLGVAGTGIAYLLYYGLIRDVGATTASMVTYLIPIVAFALGVVVRDEPAHWYVFAGAAIVIAGVALAEGRFGDGGLSVPEVEVLAPLPSDDGR